MNPQITSPYKISYPSIEIYSRVLPTDPVSDSDGGSGVDKNTKLLTSSIVSVWYQDVSHKYMNIPTSTKSVKHNELKYKTGSSTFKSD